MRKSSFSIRVFSGQGHMLCPSHGKIDSLQRFFVPENFFGGHAAKNKRSSISPKIMDSSRLMAPKIVRSSERECFEVSNEVRHQILSGDDTAGQLVLWRSTYQPGAGEPLHYHTKEDAWFLVDEGQFEFHLGESRTEIYAGDFVFAPRFTPHAYRCCSQAWGSITVGICGAGFEDFFRIVAIHFKEGNPLPGREKNLLMESFGVQLGQFDATPPAESFPQILRSPEGERFQAFDSRGRTLISAPSVQGRFSLDEWTTSPLGGPPLHVHEHENEVYLIREGRYEFQISDARIHARPGDVIVAPRLVPHAFRVVSSTPGCALIIGIPEWATHPKY